MNSQLKSDSSPSTGTAHVRPQGGRAREGWPVPCSTATGTGTSKQLILTSGFQRELKYQSHRGVQLKKGTASLTHLHTTHHTIPCQEVGGGWLPTWGQRFPKPGSLLGKLREESVSSAGRESCPKWAMVEMEGKVCISTSGTFTTPSWFPQLPPPLR